MKLPNLNTLFKEKILKLWLFILVSSASVLANAQGNIDVKYYEVMNDIPFHETDILGNTHYNSYIIAPYKSHLVIIGTYPKSKDSIIVRFIKWENNPKNIENYRDSTLFISEKDSVKGNEYFLMSKDDLDYGCFRIYPKGLSTMKFTLGFVTMPLKLRLGKKFEFEPNISLGATAGFRMRFSKHYPNYINLLFGASTSTVTLDSFTTRGKAIEPIKNALAFSPSVGFVVQFDKSQVGLFYGWDLLGASNNSRYAWIYNKKPWLSIGFGFSIFTFEDKTSAQKRD